jgi:putative endonuclease
MKIANPTARRGEDMATSFLKQKGYTIIERNFRKSYGEIDIIAVNRGILVFVEVKTRKSEKFGTALEAITPWKLREIVLTAQFYKHMHPELPDSLRIDAVSVHLNREDKLDTIDHVENIS